MGFMLAARSMGLLNVKIWNFACGLQEEEEERKREKKRREKERIVGLPFRRLVNDVKTFVNDCVCRNLLK